MKEFATVLKVLKILSNFAPTFRSRVVFDIFAKSFFGKIWHFSHQISKMSLFIIKQILDFKMFNNFLLKM